MNEEKMRRELERLERMENQALDRLKRRQDAMDKRFDRLKQHISKKYGQPNVTQQRIIDAALVLLQEEGLNNLSLRKLAAKLDMQAPALYWHFKSKEVLIDFMAEAILTKEFATIEARRDDESWQDWLVEACQRLRRAMLAYRDGGRIVAGAHLDPAITLMKLFEVSMASLTSAGIELQQANLIISTAVHFVFGNVIEEQAMPTMEEIQSINFEDMLKDYPLMAESVKQSFDEARAGYDEFEDSLRLIVGHADK